MPDSKATRSFFPKEEKLTSKKEISGLFQNRAKVSFFCFPMLVVYNLKKEVASSYPKTKFLVSIPKKKFKRSVDRNKLKRKIREQYRLTKHQIETLLPDGFSCSLLYIYSHNEIVSSIEINKGINHSFSKLKKIIQENITE